MSLARTRPGGLGKSKLLLLKCHWRRANTGSPSANRVISDYFYFNRLYAIVYDYARLFTIFTLRKPKRFFYIIQWLLHYLQKDDIALRLFYLFFPVHIIAIIAIILRLCALYLLQTIISIILFELYYCDYIFQSQLYALCTLSLDYVHYLFFVLLYALYFSNAFIRIILFSTHYMHHTIFGHWNNCYNMYN